MKTLKLGAWTAAYCLFCGAAIAAPSPSISIAAGTSYSDNADKSPSDTAFDERQDSIELGINWENSINAHSSIVLNYDIAYEQFSENSSDDEFSFNGNSGYNFALSNNITGALDHSIRQFLSNPSASQTNQNLDERSIYGAQITAKYRPSSRHTLSVTPSVDIIDYSDSDANNSRRYGISGVWNVRLNRSNDVALNLSTTRVEYENNAPDQDYEKVSVSYRKKARLFSYNADIGLNRFSSGLRDSEDPYGKFKVTFDNNIHTLGITASRVLTDTSYGNGNQLELTSRTDGNNQTIDQLTKDNIGVFYTYHELCKNCTLTLGVEALNESYVNTPSDDLNEILLSAGLSYQVDGDSTIRINYSDSEANYDSGNRDFNLQRVKLSYRHQFNRKWYWNTFADYETKDSDTATSSYSEFVAGIKVGYQLQ